VWCLTRGPPVRRGWYTPGSATCRKSGRACRAHTEPLSDLLFTQEALFTICYTGQVRCSSLPPWQACVD